MGIGWMASTKIVSHIIVGIIGVRITLSYIVNHLSLVPKLRLGMPSRNAEQSRVGRVSEA